MKPRLNRTTTLTALLLLVFLGLVIINSNTRVSSAQGTVQVTAANPSSTGQGTINLNVKVTGKGFKNGANAKWFVTGTTDPGGVTVNSTSFVSSTEVDANITVADTATVANYDIAVDNPDGRGGKGTELFAVIAKVNGNTVCPATQPDPTSDTRCYAASPGCLDTSFGAGNGFVQQNFDPTHGSSAEGFVIQPDGRIVVLVGLYSGGAIIRYNPDGSLDTSFGDPDPLNPPLRKGFASIASGNRAITLQSDGRILISGGVANTNDSKVVRYNFDGTLDTSFGAGGTATLSFGKNVISPFTDLAVQSDGKILLGGTSGGNFAIARLLPNGSLDSNFGSRGLMTAVPSGASSGNSRGFGLAIQRVPAITGEERIVLSGYSRVTPNANNDWTLMRFKPSGAVDTTFGSGGTVKTVFLGFGDTAKSVAIDSANRIIAGGGTHSANNLCGSYVFDFAAVRYLADGSLDASFGGGKQIVDIYGGWDDFYGLAIQADDKPLLIGTSHLTSLGTQGGTSSLVRLNVDGSRDTTFGPLANGIATFIGFGYGNWGLDVAVEPGDGKIVVLGSPVLAGGTTVDVMVMRYWP